MHVRRIVTGHDKDGKAVFVSDGEPPRTHVFKQVPGQEFSLVWGTEAGIRPPLSGDDPTPAMDSSLPEADGATRVTLVQLPPESVLVAPGLDGEKALAEQREVWPELLEHFEPDDPGFHRTPTIDYIVLLEGELVLELDDGAEKVVRPGDIVIQNATRHAWRNRTDSPATFVGVMIGRPSGADDRA